jgi:hypothetical protein
MTNEALPQAIAALHRGEGALARQLLKDLLAENPLDEQAWIWACEAALTSEERIDCLQHVLALNPAHAGARQYLARLEAVRPPVQPLAAAPPDDLVRAESAAPPPAVINSLSVDEPAAPATRRLLDLLLAPLGCFLQIPLRLVALIIVGLALATAGYYSLGNSDFFGLTDPHMEQFVISPSFEDIRSDSDRWQIVFEKPDQSHFSGVVRYVGPIHEVHLRLLTHDVLVTSGDYAAPAKVTTLVFLHHFSWQPSAGVTPAGAINLLHTVPASETLYRQLLALREWDRVVISGREILNINIYDAQGHNLGLWTDEGCNSLLVQSVAVTP